MVEHSKIAFVNTPAQKKAEMLFLVILIWTLVIFGAFHFLIFQLANTFPNDPPATTEEPPQEYHQSEFV